MSILTLPDLPTTPTARAAEAMAVDACAPFLLHHSYRTYLFGVMLAGDAAAALDHEAAFVAAMLHDIGLTQAHGGSLPFDEQGAEVTARLPTDRGWDPARVDLVTDAIVRHTDLAPHEVAEWRVVQAGAALDVVGLSADVLSPRQVAAVLAAHPRDGFIEGMRAAFLSEVAVHPDGAFAQLEAQVGLSGRFATHPFDTTTA